LAIAYCGGEQHILLLSWSFFILYVSSTFVKDSLYMSKLEVIYNLEFDEKKKHRKID